MLLEHLTSSIIGNTRPNNEDSALAFPEEHFFVIADGIGGLNGGEIAASEATDFFSQEIKQILLSQPSDMQSWMHLIRNSIYKTNIHVYNLWQNNPHLQEMGTTLCGLIFFKDFALLLHIGDSRIYLYREKKLYQLTQDHTIIKKELVQGQKFRYKNVITRAIGTNSLVEPEIRALQIKENDAFMLCTDGLSHFVSLKEMEEIFKKSLSLNYLTKNLLSTAQFNGSCDNISLITVTIKNLS